MTLNGAINLKLNATLQKMLDLSVPSDQLVADYSHAYTPTDVDLIYHDKITLAASASTTLDLMSMIDALGESIVFSTVKVLVIKETGGAANVTVTVGGSTNTFIGPGFESEPLLLQTNGIMAFSDKVGWSVGAGTKYLIFQNLSGSVAAEIDVIIIGKA